MARVYTDAERVAALAALDANADNLKRTSRETGIPRNTLRRWANGEGVAAKLTEQREECRTLVLARIEEVAAEVLETIPGSLPGAPPHQLATTFGILADKIIALRAFTKDGGDAAKGKPLTDADRWQGVRELLVRSGRANGAGCDSRGDAAALPPLVAECLADLELGLEAPPPPAGDAGPGDVGAV